MIVLNKNQNVPKSSVTSLWGKNYVNRKRIRKFTVREMRARNLRWNTTVKAADRPSLSFLANAVLNRILEEHPGYVWTFKRLQKVTDLGVKQLQRVLKELDAGGFKRVYVSGQAAKGWDRVGSEYEFTAISGEFPEDSPKNVQVKKLKSMDDLVKTSRGEKTYEKSGEVENGTVQTSPDNRERQNIDTPLPSEEGTPNPSGRGDLESAFINRLSLDAFNMSRSLCPVTSNEVMQGELSEEPSPDTVTEAATDDRTLAERDSPLELSDEDLFRYLKIVDKTRFLQKCDPHYVLDTHLSRPDHRVWKQLLENAWSAPSIEKLSEVFDRICEFMEALSAGSVTSKLDYRGTSISRMVDGSMPLAGCRELYHSFDFCTPGKWGNTPREREIVQEWFNASPLVQLFAKLYGPVFSQQWNQPLQRKFYNKVRTSAIHPFHVAVMTSFPLRQLCRVFPAAATLRGLIEGWDDVMKRLQSTDQAYEPYNRSRNNDSTFRWNESLWQTQCDHLCRRINDYAYPENPETGASLFTMVLTAVHYGTSWSGKPEEEIMEEMKLAEMCYSEIGIQQAKNDLLALKAREKARIIAGVYDPAISLATLPLRKSIGHDGLKHSGPYDTPADLKINPPPGVFPAKNF